ncbi:MAG: beta-N-acetylhexosaminidase [Sandaracinaceae bacterium]
MSRERWVREAGQVIIAGYAAGPVDPAILDALRRDALGGVILFARNLGPPAEVAAQIATIAEACPGAAPFVAVDQEGGRVQRLRAPVLELPPMRALGLRDDPELTRRAARELGGQLAALGFNVDFAPVLDVDTNPDNPVIGDRSFGADPELVARQGLAFAAGLADAGLLGCAKHFPGHGDTHLDSHLALPTLPHPMERLERVELVPFRHARGAIGSIMTAHIVFSALDPERPATLSPIVIQGLLRETLGYDGLIVSDDLEMKAVADHHSVPTAAVLAIRAGCDAVLVCKTREWVLGARDALADEAARDEGFARRLGEAADRCRAARERLTCAPIVEPDALFERLGSDEAERIRTALASG